MSRPRLAKDAVTINVARVAILVAFFGLWQISSERKWIKPLFIGKPTKMWDFLHDSLTRWDFLHEEVLTTLREATYGFVLGAIAGLTFLAYCIGMRRALMVFGASFVLSLGSELAGTGTGLPFGIYGYSSQLGYKIASLVPFNIPTSWFYMLVASLAICGRILPAADDSKSRWWWALVGGLVLTAWDVSMDPAMVKTNHWMWNVPDLSGTSAFSRFIGTPFFFGMPLTNWLGWLLTGVIVARVMLAIVPPSVWALKVSPYRLPLVLYAVNGLLPIAICFTHDMMLAGVLGFIAMALPLGAALRAERKPLPAPTRPSRSVGDIAIVGD